MGVVSLVIRVSGRFKESTVRAGQDFEVYSHGGTFGPYVACADRYNLR